MEANTDPKFWRHWKIQGIDALAKPDRNTFSGNPLHLERVQTFGAIRKFALFCFLVFAAYPASATGSQ